MNLNYYKVDESVIDPNFQTQLAACFDLAAYIPINEKIQVYSGKEKIEVDPLFDGLNEKWYVSVMPGERALIRTGLIFDIPSGYSMRLHPRSGMVLRYGLTLANAEGIIDEDYTLETKLIMHNTNQSEIIKIYANDRIAQAELVAYFQPRLTEIYKAPEVKSDRSGGFGSTGR